MIVRSILILRPLRRWTSRVFRRVTIQVVIILPSKIMSAPAMSAYDFGIVSSATEPSRPLAERTYAARDDRHFMYPRAIIMKNNYDRTRVASLRGRPYRLRTSETFCT